MNRSVKIFRTPYELAEKFAEELTSSIIESGKKKKYFSIALSGGSTPELLYSVLGDHFSQSAPWEYVHFFWGDERCVSPDNMESNYGMAWRTLLRKIDIPASNIHRIRGEEDPEKEVSRYSNEISDFTDKRDGLPLFDIIILGLGEDGHTASIFPGNMEYIYSDKICVVTIHPLTLQKRITITGRIINNADSVNFLVTGKKKADTVKKILKKSASSHNFPSSFIVPVYGRLNWFMDGEASGLL